MRRARRRKGRARLGALLIAVAAAAWLFLPRGEDTTAERSPAGERAARAADAERRQRAQLAPDLRAAVRRAAALGGSVEAAAMLDSWRRPLATASPPDGVRRWMRMWSMSKVVAMTALLRESRRGPKRRKALPAEVENALEGAIANSENCRQRRVVLALQESSGGTPDDARRAVAEALRMTGARARVGEQVQGPDPSCLSYLREQRSAADPLAPAVLLGTSTWRIGDAVRFAHALASGRYGTAIGERVLAAMRAPKAHSREVAPGEYTAPLDWGAGRAVTDTPVAHKAGWGGSRHGEYLAGQIAIVNLPRGRRLALAVMFHPDVQPPTDDPGLTAAPRAVQLVVESIAGELL